LQASVVNLLAGWIGMLLGVATGATIGLFFHNDEWLGGYSSYRRRLVRLGHISFFGLGFLNMIFAFSVAPLNLRDGGLTLASWSLITGSVTMPACCFLTAWRKSLRHLFPIPVLATLTGILAILIGRGLG
jgi:hypothetical protein